MPGHQSRGAIGVLLFRRLGEVEATSDDHVPINDHHLVVGDGMGGVDEGGDAGMSNEFAPSRYVPKKSTFFLPKSPMFGYTLRKNHAIHPLL